MKRERLKRVKGDSYYGQTAENYEKKRIKQPWWAVEQKEMKDLLSLLPKGLSVLDVPFGTGRFVPYYHEREFTVYGLDASDEIMQSAARILGDAYDKCQTVRGYSTELPFEDAQFDLVVSTRFLRDIVVFSDAKKTLSEFSRVCKSYAILQLGFKLYEPFELPKDDERMGSRLSREQTYALLKSHGFEVMETRKVKGQESDAWEIHHFLLRRVRE